MSDEYLIPAGYGEAEFTEKRSRFIGRVWLVENEEEALSRLKETRERHWDARHNVYAYHIRTRNGSSQTEGGEYTVMRYSDDGEPQGSSGLPTLNVFRSAGVYNFCCVVTRYFGGILLGTGGLARAYSSTAALALESAGLRTVRLRQRLLIACPYELYQRLKRELERRNALICGSDFAADVTVEAMLDKSETEGLNDALREMSAGTVEALVLSEEMC